MIEHVIGLNGRLHSGKDTAFEAIRNYFAEAGMATRRVAFADPLKKSAAAALGYSEMRIEEAVAFCNILKESGRITVTWDEPLGFPRGTTFSGREFLQWYGTEAHRDVFSDDFWVTATLPPSVYELDEKYPDTDVLVVTDVRFPNESERIADLLGHVWHIDAEQRLGPLPDDAHPSERPLPDHLIDRWIRNNDTLEDYQRALSFALTKIAHA